MTGDLTHHIGVFGETDTKINFRVHNIRYIIYWTTAGIFWQCNDNAADKPIIN